MITDDLLSILACPICLQPQGCPVCAREAGHASCQDDYSARAGCLCGGPDKVALRAEGEALLCPCCGGDYAMVPQEGHVNLLPRGREQDTLYADHEFQERLHVSDAPPLLSARVKADMMRLMLEPRPGQRLLDLGCGAGKMALFASRDGVRATGVDAAPFFLSTAAAAVELVAGDLRRLPFRKGAFQGAFSIDVLEHLDEPGVREVLVEARRVLAPGGGLFVYTHAMESSRLASFQRGVNRLARRLGRAGLIDHEREALRKSDHRNPIRSHEHFDQLCAQAGLALARRRYYNVVFKAVVEDLGLRLFEQAWRRRGGGQKGQGHDHARAPAARAPGRAALALGHALTWLLKLDVVLFGGVRTGPFFALLRPAAKEAPGAPPPLPPAMAEAVR